MIIISNQWNAAWNELDRIGLWIELQSSDTSNFEIQKIPGGGDCVLFLQCFDVDVVVIVIVVVCCLLFVVCCL